MRHRSLVRRAWCDAELPQDLRNTILSGDLDRVLFQSAPLQVKDRCVVARHECAGGPLLVKRHEWGDAWRTLRMAFREPAARRCARLGLYLHGHGIPTPRPRAYADHRFGPWAYRSYLATDYVEGESLYRYIRFGSQTPDELQHVARQVARIWQTLVELGISHNDMKPENFIVDQNRDVWLIDLEKMRIGGRACRQRQRHVFDVQNFLHVRGWHHRADARTIFADAFLQTPHSGWLQAAGVDRAAMQVDAELSTVILCNGGIEMSLARRAIDSVHDIADEIVLVEPGESGCLDLLKRIDVCQPAKAHSSNPNKFAERASATSIARGPWVLVLHQDECVTPFLAKELRQRIADERSRDAFCIPIERQYFGRSLAPRRSENAPIRLFRQPPCSIESAGDLLSVVADPQCTAHLTGTIQKCVYATVAELVAHLNDETTRAAEFRLQRGDRARFGRAAWRSVIRFCRSFLPNGGIRSGWTGFQLSVLESVFCWIEEAKLYQLAAEFRTSDAAAASDDERSLSLPTHFSSPPAESRRAKAA